MNEPVVLDASALIDVLVFGVGIGEPRDIHVPAHFDSEVLSGLGRLARAGVASDQAVARHLTAVADAPFIRHPVTDLLVSAWDLRHNLRLADALYVALAERLGMSLLTTDAGLAAAYDGAELIS